MIQDDRLLKKEDYLIYLEDVPKHKFASKHTKISEDTSKRWRDEDSDFADQCEQRISVWVRRQLKKANPEFQLERLLREDFSQRTELTGADGEPLVIIKDGNTTKPVADNSMERPA